MNIGAAQGPSDFCNTFYAKPSEISKCENGGRKFCDEVVGRDTDKKACRADVSRNEENKKKADDKRRKEEDDKKKADDKRRQEEADRKKKEEDEARRRQDDPIKQGIFCSSVPRNERLPNSCVQTCREFDSKRQTIPQWCLGALRA
ncbi:hypothetical protein EJ08DRAFT_646970 [Tothia fuscella]|uniref:Uncharacterized protein n=1 Tax=Tothia fuscella TaxID=1048955 RepID=A0A9P4NYP9_9PEZI|nr:hypothetical protein EJ08DRAFT_646970 [Tothia fuscella]